MHTPLPIDNTTLHDLGFEALPYLNVDAVSEGLVYGGGVDAVRRLGCLAGWLAGWLHWL